MAGQGEKQLLVHPVPHLYLFVLGTSDESLLLFLFIIFN